MVKWKKVELEEIGEVLRAEVCHGFLEAQKVVLDYLRRVENEPSTRNSASIAGDVAT